MARTTISSREKTILALLLQGESNLTTIADNIGISKPGALKILNSMENEGFISSESTQTPRGKSRTFRVNKFSCILSVDPQRGIIMFSANSSLNHENPLMGQVPQREMRKDVSLYIKELTKIIGQDLAIILFGSVALGESTRKSDIDLLLINKQGWNDKRKKTAMDAIYRASLKANTQAKPLFVSIVEFLSKEDYFSKNIKEEGMILHDAIGEDSLWAAMNRYWNITD